MHYRFFKRFFVSAVFFILCGFLLISKWSFKIKTIGLIGQAKHATFSKVKRLTSGVLGSGEQFSTASFDDDNNDDDVKYPVSTGWVQKVLDKNLTREETVNQLLKEMDNHITHIDVPPTSDENSLIEVRTDVNLEPHTTATSVPALTETTRPTVIRQMKRKRKKRKRPNKKFAGYLNLHVWQAWCGSTVEDLKRNKHFPLYPDMRTTTDELFVRHGERSYGQRIYGFLHPPKSGNYTFYLSSDDNSELWLSTSSSPDKIRKIAWLGNATDSDNVPVAYFSMSDSQISKKIQLSRDQMYYIEVLHKQNAFSDHVLVSWKGPAIPKVKKITGRYLSAYVDEFELSSDVNILAEYIPETRASFPTHHHGTLNASPLLLKNLSQFGAQDQRDHFHLTPFIDDSDVANILPICRYSPSYLVDFEVNRYEGVYLIHETAVFPDDKTELTHMISITDCDVRNRDSHRNSLRPTASGAHSESNSNENSDSEFQMKAKSKASRYGTLKLGSSFDSLLGKLKKRFKDFNTYMKSNLRIFGSSKNREVNSVLSKSARNAKVRINGKRMKKKSEIVSDKQKTKEKINRGRGFGTRETSTMYDSSPKSKKMKLGEEKAGARLSSPRYLPENKLEEKSDKKVSDKDNLSQDKKEKRSHFDNYEEEDNDDEFNENDKVLIGKDGFVRLRPLKEDDSDENSEEVDARNKLSMDAENAEREMSPEENTDQIFVKDQSRKRRANDGYEAMPKGRKLLGVKINKNLIDASETDDEGLPATWNNFHRSKPIFVPIAGVENENKSLPALKPTQRSRFLRRAISSRKENAEESEPFEIKSYYKRFNITSNRDVINKFKVFKYAFYDMIKDLPRLHSWKFHQDVTSCKSDGNLRLNEKVATSIVDKYMRALKQKHGDKYVLKKIINVEENHDVINGDRYLIELDLKVKGQEEKSVRLSRYVYQQLGNTNLCQPEGFQWNRHTTVHVIVPVKNQGRWVQHFIDNMEKIYLETLDQHLSVIIVDFNSTDIDIELSLKSSKLKRYKLIKLDGPFQRALGIQAGADYVKNPHDIIFTCDLHLEIPSSLIDSIRKHCVEGKMAFAPIVVRLDCGYLPENPYGLWELQGYGLFAICKSDFDRAGGMNTEEFKTKWGGEDWEMLDRQVLSVIHAHYKTLR
eukprot:gene13058-3834_t